NGIVYIGFGSHCDNNPFHGWLLGYNASTLAQVSVFMTTPNGEWGGIWQGGGAPTADAAGNIFIGTGNGTYDLNTGGPDISDSYLKLSPGANGFTLADYFTPFDYFPMWGGDLDLGSGAQVLLPDQPGTYPHLLVGCGKEGTIYLVNRDNMGHLTSSTTSDP